MLLKPPGRTSGKNSLELIAIYIESIITNKIKPLLPISYVNPRILLKVRVFKARSPLSETSRSEEASPNVGQTQQLNKPSNIVNTTQI
jgi:hypothetical protein